jgi:hypothetical protein
MDIYILGELYGLTGPRTPLLSDLTLLVQLARYRYSSAQMPIISDLQQCRSSDFPSLPVHVLSRRVPVRLTPTPTPRTLAGLAPATNPKGSNARRSAMPTTCRLPPPGPDADGSGPIARVLSSIYLPSPCRRPPINTAWLLGAETTEAAIALHRCSFSP